MFTWYGRAEVCYAYLSDVEWYDTKLGGHVSRLGHSRWFTRGWTLQELLAPTRIDYFSRDWILIEASVKCRHADADNFLEGISAVTGIVLRALKGFADLREFRVAEKMSWAARRETTRIEDVAYSLMGIFDINMPLLYGEGEKAFGRLQEQILSRTEDYSIFAWQSQHAKLDMIEVTPVSFFASHPSEFGQLTEVIDNRLKLQKIPFGLSGSLDHLVHADSEPPSVTARGIRMNLLLTDGPDSTVKYGLLSALGKQRWLCVPIRRYDPKLPIYGRAGSLIVLIIEDPTKVSAQLIYASNETVRAPFFAG